LGIEDSKEHVRYMHRIGSEYIFAGRLLQPWTKNGNKWNDKKERHTLDMLVFTYMITHIHMHRKRTGGWGGRKLLLCKEQDTSLKVQLVALTLDSLAKGNGLGLPSWRPLCVSKIYLYIYLLSAFMIFWVSFSPCILYEVNNADCESFIIIIWFKQSFSFVFLSFRPHLSGQKNGSKNFKHKVAFYILCCL
jgi:hypothetical protein